MKINIIENVHVFKNDDVHKRDEDWLFLQPDRHKEFLGMFNYWSEKKRGGLSDSATLAKLVLDYDNGAKRADVEKAFEEYDYLIYNSTGNQLSQGIEKFRLIITLKEPILASDMRYWRDREDFKKQFEGVDISSFHVGRFFYRASKYDKDRAEVVISHHEGDPFDFYALYPHHVTFAPFEKLKAQLLSSRMKPNITKRIDIFEEWVKNRYPCGTHYADICAFCRRAYSCGLEEYEAEERFGWIYAGNSNWRPNFKKVYGNMR